MEREKKLQKKPPNFSLRHFLCSLLCCTPTHCVCCCGLALPCLMFGANECLWRSFHKQANNSGTNLMHAFIYIYTKFASELSTTDETHTHTQPEMYTKQSRETLQEYRQCSPCIFTRVHEYMHTFQLAALKPLQHTNIPIFAVDAAHLEVSCPYPRLPSCKETDIYPWRFLLL